MFIAMSILRNSTPAGVELFLLTMNFYKQLMPLASFNTNETPNTKNIFNSNGQNSLSIGQIERAGVSMCHKPSPNQPFLPPP